MELISWLRRSPGLGTQARACRAAAGGLEHPARMEDALERFREGRRVMPVMVNEGGCNPERDVYGTLFPSRKSVSKLGHILENSYEGI